MTIPFFYEPAIGQQTIVELSEETARHVGQVLRMRQGEPLNLTDGQGHLFQCVLQTVAKKTAVVKVQTTTSEPAPTVQVAMGVSLLKNASRWEWFLEKATEIGVKEIFPLLCERTEKQHFRQDRMQAIAVSAMLQSQQTWLPQLHAPMDYRQLLGQFKFSTKLIAHCLPDENKTPTPKATTSTLLLIGPEGDFSPDEIVLAKNAGYQPVSLGNQRLRTETAAIVAATCLCI
jgi:16S rRNA (uracil1498-N3)-methyltransferase